MVVTSRLGLVLFVVFAALVVRGLPAHADPLSSIQDCDAQFGKRSSKCRKCVNGDGKVFQKVGKGWACKLWKGPGLKPGMHRSVAIKSAPPPPIPKTMPATQKAYVTVLAGTFTIGELPTETYRNDNEYRSKVTITRPFLMKTTEVTENEWYFVMKTPSVLFKRDCMDCPVADIRWRQAIEYLNALSKLEQLAPCYEVTDDTVTWKGLDCTGYRLPTEAEWEYAARAGVEAKVYGPVDDIAWHGDNSDGKAHVGGGKQANAFGLHDMLGNVAEWVWDGFEWSAFEQPQTDPIIGGLVAKTDAGERMVRGADFFVRGEVMRVASRDQRMPVGAGDDQVGFRPVRSLPKRK